MLIKPDVVAKGPCVVVSMEMYTHFSHCTCQIFCFDFNSMTLTELRCNGVATKPCFKFDPPVRPPFRVT